MDKVLAFASWEPGAEFPGRSANHPAKKETSEEISLTVWLGELAPYIGQVVPGNHSLCFS